MSESGSWYKDNFFDSGYDTSESDNTVHTTRRQRHVLDISNMAGTARTVSFTPSLSPSRGDDIINYKTTDGLKTYKRATEALKDKYDGKSMGLAVFRMQLLGRAKSEGWMNQSSADIINIPQDGIDKSNGTINVLKEQSRISNNTIKLWARTKLLGKPSVDRSDQNNENMGLCIIASLSKKRLAAIYLKESMYTVDGIVIAPLLYKVIMDGAELDTMVTSAIIRQELQELDVKIIELNSNITDFVEWVNANIKKLESRGESATEGDLIMNIFKSLKVVKDNFFRQNFTTFEYDWLSGRKQLTSESLLNPAETYYKVKVQSKSWGALSKEEEELIAMKAVFKDLNLRLDAEKNKKNLRNKNSSRTKDKSLSQGKKIPKCKLENNKNEKKMKKDGKTYFWCKGHNDNKGQWVLHHPSKCKNCPGDDEQRDDSNTQEQAMAAINEEDEESLNQISVSSKESDE